MREESTKTFLNRSTTLRDFLPPVLIFIFLCSSTVTPDVFASEPLGNILSWGSDAEGGAPYVYPDPNDPTRLIGFEVDLTQALAKEMGMTAKQSQIDWSSLIPGLKRGDFLIAMNGIEWTADRAREVAFSKPYYVFAQQLVVRKDEQAIQSFNDIAGHRIATLEGTAAHDLLLKTPGVEIASYRGQVEPYRDLELGRVNAVLLDTPIAAHTLQSHPALKYAGPPVSEGVYVVAVRKENPVLLNKINRALDSLFKSGELQSIYAKWGLWNDAQTRLLGKQPDASPSQNPSHEKALWFYLPLLLKGAGMTVILSVVSMALAIALGLAVCLTRLAGGPLLKLLAVGYIEIMRGTPLLLQLYIIYYGLPNIGINLNAFTAAVLGLGLNYAAYEAEIYRGGLKAIPRGQTEAALSLGMTSAMIYRRILIPQTAKMVLPPVTNDFISLFKDSSLVSIIAIVELTKTYNMLAVSSMRFLELGVLTAILYLTMSLPLSFLSPRLERRAQ